MIAGFNLVFQLLDNDPAINWKLFGILLYLAGLSELLEYIITAVSSRRSGASKRAMFGAVIGSIVGAVIGTGIFPVIGSLIGALGGAFVGAFLIEYLENYDRDRAIKIGIGAFTGVAGGKLTKIALAIIMLVMIALNGSV